MFIGKAKELNIPNDTCRGSQNYCKYLHEVEVVASTSPGAWPVRSVTWPTGGMGWAPPELICTS